MGVIMAVKKQPILAKEDFEQALITLRLSVSEVSRETGIPRHIVTGCVCGVVVLTDLPH